jgi:hypothetical protein
LCGPTRRSDGKGLAARNTLEIARTTGGGALARAVRKTLLEQAEADAAAAKPQTESNPWRGAGRAGEGGGADHEGEIGGFKAKADTKKAEADRLKTEANAATAKQKGAESANDPTPAFSR